jgi:hypothetical protein
MVSLGKYNLVNSEEYATNPLMALLTALEKKIHGSRAENTNSGYGTPLLVTLATREKMSVYSAIMTSGCNIAQAQPSIDCL